MKTLAQLKKDYPCIVQWGYELQSFQYYINEQLREAERLNAPRNTIYFDHQTGSPVTTDGMKNIELKERLESFI